MGHTITASSKGYTISHHKERGAAAKWERFETTALKGNKKKGTCAMEMGW